MLACLLLGGHLGTQLVLPAPSLSFIPTTYELWIGSQDSQGHRYLTRYTMSA